MTTSTQLGFLRQMGTAITQNRMYGLARERVNAGYEWALAAITGNRRFQAARNEVAARLEQVGADAIRQRVLEGAEQALPIVRNAADGALQVLRNGYAEVERRGGVNHMAQQALPIVRNAAGEALEVLRGGYAEVQRQGLVNIARQAGPAVQAAAGRALDAADARLGEVATQIQERGGCGLSVAVKTIRLADKWFGKACGFAWKKINPTSKFPMEQYAGKIAGAAATWFGTLIIPFCPIPSTLAAGAVYVGVDMCRAETTDNLAAQLRSKIVPWVGASAVASLVLRFGLPTSVLMGYVVADIRNAKAEQGNVDVLNHPLMKQILATPVTVQIRETAKTCLTMGEILREYDQSGKISLARCTAGNPLNEERDLLKKLFLIAVRKNPTQITQTPGDLPPVYAEALTSAIKDSLKKRD